MEAGDIYSTNEKKVCKSTSPTASRRFSRFTMVEKRRMGGVRRQYEELTVYQLLLICDIAEEDWSKSNYEELKK